MADLSDWLCRAARGNEQRAPGAALFEIDRGFLNEVKNALGLASDEVALAQALAFVRAASKRIAAERKRLNATGRVRSDFRLETWKPRNEKH